MNFQKRAELIDHFLNTWIRPVMESKGGAYSRGEENCNSNFYRNAEAFGVHPLQPCWLYGLKHVDAISSWVKNGLATGDWPADIAKESVESRIGDLINYALILYTIAVQEGILEDPSGKD